LHDLLEHLMDDRRCRARAEEREAELPHGYRLLSGLSCRCGPNLLLLLLLAKKSFKPARRTNLLLLQFGRDVCRAATGLASESLDLLLRLLDATGVSNRLDLDAEFFGGGHQRFIESSFFRIAIATKPLLQLWESLRPARHNPLVHEIVRQILRQHRNDCDWPGTWPVRLFHHQ
jgi:hypothetical protein